MAIRIFDTEMLISHYNRMTKSKSDQTVREHARLLIDFEKTNWILSPVRIEFLCGARDRNEFRLFSAYLEPFSVLDERKIPPGDWSDAERHAQWVKKSGGARKLGDCLIRAIADRLNGEVITRDKHFSKRIPPRQS